MSRFMEELLGKVHAVDPSTVAGPPEAVAEGETVVGVLPDELRAFWTVRHGIFLAHDEKEAASIDAEVEAEKETGADGPSPALKARLEASAAQSEYLEAVSTVFWASVRHEFPGLAGKDNIGVRAGWKVVWYKGSGGPVVVEVVEISLGHRPKQGFLDVLLGRGKRPN